MGRKREIRTQSEYLVKKSICQEVGKMKKVQKEKKSKKQTSWAELLPEAIRSLGEIVIVNDEEEKNPKEEVREEVILLKREAQHEKG
jgi:hypothetical protein